MKLPAERTRRYPEAHPARETIERDDGEPQVVPQQGWECQLRCEAMYDDPVDQLRCYKRYCWR